MRKYYSGKSLMFSDSQKVLQACPRHPVKNRRLEESREAQRHLRCELLLHLCLGCLQYRSTQLAQQQAPPVCPV